VAWQVGQARARNYKAPSIDRIDSNGNCALGNLQIVMQVVNLMKNDLSSNMFVAICQQVAEHNLFLQVRVMVTRMDR